MERSTSHPERRVHLRISGRVQGVSFRFYTQRQAQALGLAGWVRNCADGSVEVVVEGLEDAVAAFVAWAYEGPSAADVSHVEVHPEQPRGERPPFRVVG